MSKFAGKQNGILLAPEMKSAKNKVLYWIMFGFLVTVALMGILPSVWVLLSGFKDVKEMYQIPASLFPEEIRLGKLVEVWNYLDFKQAYISTIILSAGEIAFAIVFPALGGYVLSRLRPRGSKFVRALLLWTMMMPAQMRMVPIFMSLMNVPILNISLTNSYLPFWFMCGANIFDCLLFKSFFDSIPISYLEAGRIDGCSDLKIFTSIILPLSKPVIAVIVIRTFIQAWGSYIWPLLLIQDENLAPMGLKLYRLRSGYRIDEYMLGLIYGILPVFIMYLCFHKQIIKGMNIGGIKG